MAINIKKLESKGYKIKTICFSWLVVCLAVERFLVVKYPLKAKQLSSKKKALGVAISCVIAGMLVNSYRFWMVDYNSASCKFQYNYISFYKLSGLFVSLSNIIIPIAVIWIFYMMLVWLVRRRRGTASSSSSGNKKEKLTITVLYICLAYLVFSTPHAVYLITARLRNWVLKPTASSLVFNAITTTLMRLNFATNFFIYVASNEQFRNRTKELFRIGNRVEPVTENTTQS